MNRAERRRRARQEGKPSPAEKADALFAEALADYQAGRLEPALKGAERALRAEPGHVNALQLAGMASVQLRRTEKALSYLDKKTRLDPDDPHGYVNLGVARHQAGDPEAAIACHRRALALDDTLAEAHLNLGVALKDLDRTAEAEDALARALALAPDDVSALLNLAQVVRTRGRPAEAVALFDRALALRPDDAEARWQRSFTRLGMGDFSAETIGDYDLRWRAASFGDAERAFPQSPWSGEPVANERLLLWAEQGVGDQLCHAGIVPALQAAGMRCVLDCDPRLETLFARSFPEAQVAVKSDPPAAALLDPGIDVQAPMASAGLRYRMHRPEAFPLDGYLVANPARKQAIAARLADFAKGRPAMGISWRSARAKVGPAKSMPLELWGPILGGRDCVFVNLQYGETADEVAEAAAATGAEIYTDPEIDRFDGLEDLAALIDCLDGVISTSNVTAHFAGGLGRPCLLALQKAPLWYWGSEEAPVPLYASVRRFWQRTENDWSDVIAAVAAALDGVLAG